MNRFAGLVLMGWIFAVAGLCQDVPEEQKALDGTWLPTTAEMSGKPLDEATRKSMKLVLEGEKYTVTLNKVADKGTIKIDPMAKPKSMDILGTEGPNKGRTLLAIYEVKGDTLRICYDLSGKKRPTEFTTQTGDKNFLVKYERTKP
jgi:uncharacterized protein (TIGR03067 family)